MNESYFCFMRSQGYPIIIFLIWMLAGCGSGVLNPSGEKHEPGSKSASSHLPEFAKGFLIEPVEEGFMLKLFDPWNPGKELIRYLVSDASTSASGSYINTIKPINSRIVVASTTHVAFLSALGASAYLAGSTNPARICDPEVSERFHRGDFLNLGRDLDFNLEALVMAAPDLIMQTGFEGQLSRDSRLHELGIPVLYFHEWMEPTPLGRTEWIKVAGLVTGKMPEADSLFNIIRDQYLWLVSMAGKRLSEPMVMSGNDFKGTWYMPGGNNYMARLFQDAGFNYPFERFKGSASMALGFESVLEMFDRSDIWIGVTSRSIKELVELDSRYKRFNPVITGRVYHVYKRENHTGGNDLWERGVVRPDEMLEDLIRIGHPGLLKDSLLHYYQKLD